MQLRERANKWEVWASDTCATAYYQGLGACHVSSTQIDMTTLRSVLSLMEPYRTVNMADVKIYWLNADEFDALTGFDTSEFAREYHAILSRDP